MMWLAQPDTSNCKFVIYPYRLQRLKVGENEANKLRINKIVGCATWKTIMACEHYSLIRALFVDIIYNIL